MSAYRDPEWLRRNYHGEGLTQREIAEECDVTPRTIRRYMDEFDIPTRDLEGENHPLYGTDRSEAVREKISKSLTGIERSEATRQRMSESTAGRANPNWAGGYDYRYGEGWAVARKRVRERDDVCQHCGHDGAEQRLEVHHIVPVRRFREAEDAQLANAHDEQNLVLLCRTCHGRADHGELDVGEGVGPDGEEQGL